MRRLWVITLVLCMLGLCRASEPNEEEKAVGSKVVSVALFKNGLAVIKREVELTGPGIYRLKDVPEPVHGTFWVESNRPMEARVEMRETKPETTTHLGVNLQEELAGLKVTIQGRNNKTPIVGTVIKIPKKDPAEPSTSSPWYEENRAYRPEPVSRFLLLKTDKGVSYVDANDIASLEAEGQPEQPMQEKPVLLIDATKETKPGVAHITYLAHGLSWAPSYIVDVSDPKKLSIEQHAVIRNELADLTNTDFSLISGFPSVQFGHVTSPLAATQNWQHFFQQLNQRDNYQVSGIMAQQAVAYNRRGPGGGEPVMAPNMGDTLDLNFHGIGNRSMKKGSSLALTTGKSSADYERIVDWTIPDNRDEWGSPRENRQVDPNTGEPLQDDVWDALKFKNPLPFPMTTAPAMVISQGKFSGQRQVLWTNQGEEATLKINKALSIRARNVEFEEQKGNGVSEREIIHIGGRRFRRATVNGELRLCNHRSADIKLIIKRHFSGDLVKADANPKVDLREEGIWTVNKRNELNWTLNLKPGEEKTIAYQYTVLVNF